MSLLLFLFLVLARGHAAGLPPLPLVVRLVRVRPRTIATAATVVRTRLPRPAGRLAAVAVMVVLLWGVAPIPSAASPLARRGGVVVAVRIGVVPVTAVVTVLVALAAAVVRGMPSLVAATPVPPIRIPVLTQTCNNDCIPCSFKQLATFLINAHQIKIVHELVFRGTLHLQGLLYSFETKAQSSILAVSGDWRCFDINRTLMKIADSAKTSH